MDISQLSFNELQNLLALIPKEIERRKKEEKSKARRDLEALAAERGFTLSELIEVPVKKERGPVAIKYRHPSNTELTWTGRGRQPLWIGEFIAAGGSLESLKV